MPPPLSASSLNSSCGGGGLATTTAADKYDVPSVITFAADHVATIEAPTLAHLPPVEDEVGQEERQDEKIEDEQQREESGEVKRTKHTT